MISSNKSNKSQLIIEKEKPKYKFYIESMSKKLELKAVQKKIQSANITSNAILNKETTLEATIKN